MADDPKKEDAPPKPTEDPKVFSRPEDEAGKKALQTERDARKQAEKQAKELTDQLKAIEDKDKSEVERLTGQVASLTEERDRATAERDRSAVAVAKGLTATQAKRLVGSTVEELESDADELLASWGDKTVKPAGKPTERLKSGGEPDAPVEETDLSKLGERMFSR